jgi:hypothetical protein
VFCQILISLVFDATYFTVVFGILLFLAKES